MKPPIFIRSFLGVLLALLCLAGTGRAASANDPQWDGHLVLVLPFENQSTQPGLDWIGESFPTILNERLNSAGFLTIRREDRQYALQHLGLPAGFHPTHATIYRVAQTLDADYVVLGTYTVSNGRVTAVARILRMNAPAMNPSLEETASLNQLLDVEDSLAWQIARQIDPHFAVEKQTFLAAGQGIRLDTFENYIRGQIEPSITERIRHLNTAIQLSPTYNPALLALGKTYFANQQYELAAATFTKIPAGNRRALEAQFYSGLAYLYTGNYPKAEAAFSAVAAVLPLPEVLNNQGIALNRRGQDGTALFQRAVKLDPQNADYWFNLAVSERRFHHYSKALDAARKSIALHSQDEEAQHLQEHLLAEEKSPAKPAIEKVAKPAIPADTTTSATTTDTADTTDSSEDVYEPLERIERTYNETSFRQAAFEMDQMRSLKLQTLPPAQQATEFCKEGQSYINQGLLLEAERQFQQALAADPNNAAAHAGLAQIREYTGNASAAQQQANTSLKLQPNVAAYLVLARLSLQQRQFSAARQSVQSALQLDPNNTAANGILQAIQVQEKQTP